MKIRKLRLLSAVLALMLCAMLAVPVGAAAKKATEYDNAAQLFSESLLGDETIEHAGVNIKHDVLKGTIKTESVTTTDRYQRRVASASITVDADATVADIFRVEIPKGETLTIEKGATLTVYGELSIEGKLVNNGTIVIGYKSKAVDADKKATLENRGRLTNNGTLNIRCGELVNETIGKLENKGTINITNKLNGYRALSNRARQSGETLKAGEITNTGKIVVKNTDGVGIYNQKNAVLDNQGEITCTEQASVEGKIKGNKVQVTG